MNYVGARNRRPEVSLMATIRIFAVLVSSVFLAACAGATISNDPNWSLSESKGTQDDVKRVLAANERGIVVADVKITREGNSECGSGEMYVGREGDLKATLIRGHVNNFGTITYAGTLTTLPPGDYLVRRAGCMFGNTKFFFNGPHAKFKVVAGQVTDIGLIRIDYKPEGLLGMTGTAKRWGEPISAEVLAVQQREIPEVFPNIVKRQMTVIEPTDFGYKR
jgi:hypothetical protein